MVYIEKLMLVDEDTNWRMASGIINTQTSDEWFPIGFFAGKQLERVDFEPITIFYGGNGSGKTTLLNILADKLGLERSGQINRTYAMQEYTKLCNVTYASGKSRTSIPAGSKILTSDDVFNHILNVRADNILKAREKEDMAEAYSKYKYEKFTFSSLEDYEELKLVNASRRKSRRKFVKAVAGERDRQFSNGENAMLFFDKQIGENALYLLDEPENSMSPEFQLRLKKLIGDSARYFGCQFVIATHSPFILSLPGAKIYNMDSVPVYVEKWHELKNVRAYYDLFKENEHLFLPEKDN